MKEKTVPLLAGGQFGGDTFRHIGIFVPDEASMKEHEPPLFSSDVRKSTAQHLSTFKKRIKKNLPLRINNELISKIIEHDKLCRDIAIEMAEFSAIQWESYKSRLLRCVKHLDTMSLIKKTAIQHVNIYKEKEKSEKDQLLNYAVAIISDTIIEDIWGEIKDPEPVMRAELVRNLDKELTRAAILRACRLLDESGKSSDNIIEYIRHGAERNFG